MSRIGKKPVPIPDGVKVVLKDRCVSVEGPAGKLRWTHRPEIDVQFDESGKIKSTLTPWAEAAKAVAAESKVPFIDLHAASINYHNKIGLETSMTFNLEEGDVFPEDPTYRIWSSEIAFGPDSARIAEVVAQKYIGVAEMSPVEEE